MFKWFQTPRGKYGSLYGHDTLSCFGSKIWSILPEEVKNSSGINDFKSNIKKWIPNHCPCRLCKDSICSVGYVNLTDKLIVEVYVYIESDSKLYAD